jgi:DNA mismatch repair protein MutL
VERFGIDAFVIRQVPAALAAGEVERAFRDLAQIIQDAEAPGAGQEQAADRLHHRLAATIACHAAVKIHFPLAREKMENLLERLFRCQEPLTCPHGRTVVLRWPHDAILRAFGRL